MKANQCLSVIPVVSQVKSLDQAYKGNYAGARETRRISERSLSYVRKLGALSRSRFLGIHPPHWKRKRIVADGVPIINQGNSACQAGKGDEVNRSVSQ